MPKWQVGRISAPRDWDRLTAGFSRICAVTYVASPRDILRLFDQGCESVELILGHTLDDSSENALHKGMKKEDATAIDRMASLMESGRLTILVPKRREHSKYYVLETSEKIRFISPSYNLTGSRQGNTYMFLEFTKLESNDRYDEALKPYEQIKADSSVFAPGRDLVELVKGKSGEERARRITVWLSGDSEPSEEEESDKVTLSVAEIVAKALAKVRTASDSPSEDTFFTVKLPSDPRERKQFLEATARWDPR